MYTIYQFTNKINGKKYVGCTSTPLKERLDAHFLTAKNNKCKYLLHRAIRKYGQDTFQIDTLEEGIDSEYGFKVREPYFIKVAHSHMSEGGYNMTLGGDGILGFKHSKESKQKMSLTRKGRPGKPHTEEFKKRMSIIQKNRIRQPMSEETKNKLYLANIGTKRPEGTGQKISLAKKGKPVAPRSPEVYKKIVNILSKQWDITSPEGSKERITNLQSYCRENNLHSGAMIMVSQGKRPHHKGYVCERVV